MVSFLMQKFLLRMKLSPFLSFLVHKRSLRLQGSRRLEDELFTVVEGLP